MDAQHHGNLPRLAAPELDHHLAVDLESLGAAAASHAGLSRPGKDDATGQGGVKGNGKADSSDCAEAWLSRQVDVVDDGKHFATLEALLGRMGVPHEPH